MNLKEYAKQESITLAEAKERTGLTHWNQTVQEGSVSFEEMVEILDIKPEVEPVIEKEPVIETPSKQEIVIETVSKEDKIKSVRGLGTKSPYWSEING